MKVILISFLLTSVAFAGEGPCANKAKYEAIRHYKAESGTIQGSDGPQYSAVLIKANGNVYDYEVTIADNNEDGDYWEVDYKVRVQEKNRACKTIFVKKAR